MAPAQLLKGHTFAFSGKLDKPQKHYADLIKKHGGTVFGTINLSTEFLVSNEDSVNAAALKEILFAQKHSTPIVREGFLGACIAEGKLLDSAHFAIHPTAKRKAEPKAPAAKRRRVGLACGVSDEHEVIEKSGLADKCKVLQESMKQGFMKATLTWDAETLLHNPDLGKDSYFNLQLLASSAGDGQFWVVYHWGRTGMPGGVHVNGPTASLEKAKKAFKKKFRQRTGNSWGHLAATFVEQPGKYKLLVSAADAKEEEEEKGEGRWQYYLHNKVDGKQLGWYDYAAGAAKNMEKYWLQFKRNPGLHVRIIRSDYFKYEVNFAEMTQCNQTSGMRRAIRRVPPSQKSDPPAAPPAEIPKPVKPIAEGETSDDDDDEEEKESASESEDEAAADAEEADAEEEEAEPAAVAEEDEDEAEVEPKAAKPRAAASAGRRAAPAPAGKKRAAPGDAAEDPDDAVAASGGGVKKR